MRRVDRKRAAVTLGHVLYLLYSHSCVCYTFRSHTQTSGIHFVSTLKHVLYILYSRSNMCHICKHVSSMFCFCYLSRLEETHVTVDEVWSGLEAGFGGDQGCDAAGGPCPDLLSSGAVVAWSPKLSFSSCLAHAGCEYVLFRLPWPARRDSRHSG